MKRFRLYARVCMFLSFFGQNAFSDSEPNPIEKSDLSTFSLEQLMQIEVPTVVGASRHEQKISDAPSSVTIISAQDIKMLGYRTLSDILDGVRGFYMTFDGLYNFAGVRGLNRPGDWGGRYLLNINGHRINEPIYDAAFWGYELPIDIDLIERVEVIRGPGSSLYGNNAFFAVINIVTRKAEDISLHGGEIAASYGYLDSKKARVTHSLHLNNGVDLILSSSYYNSPGAKALFFPGEGFGLAHNLDSTSSPSVFGSLSYKGLTLEGSFGSRSRKPPSAPYGTIFDDPDSLYVDTRGLLELRYQRIFSENWEVFTRAYSDYYNFEGYSPYNFGTPGLERVLERDTARAVWWGMEGQINYTFLKKHRLTLGTEFRHDPIRHQLNVDSPPADVINIDINTPSYTVGAYAQGEFVLVNNLILNAGARYDYFAPAIHTINPRAALIYHPHETTTLKLLFGQAFRAPNAYESAFQATVYLANPNLQPETTRAYEFVLEQGITNHFRLTNSYFFNDINSLITQVSEQNENGETSAIYRNTDKVYVIGGDLELEAKFGKGFKSRISYTLAKALNSVDFSTLTNSPAHVGKAQFFLPIFRENIFLVLEIQAMSERTTDPRGETPSETLPGFAVGNLTIFSQDIVKNLEISATVYNIWNQQYNDPAAPDFVMASIPRSGVSGRGTVSYRF